MYRVPLLERSTLSKVDRYTLKVKNNSNGMCDDGYKWRKYGQKSIKNSPNPRYIYAFSVLELYMHIELLWFGQNDTY